jgi:hypothetical protein
MTQNTNPGIVAPALPAGSVCQTRSELLDRLASTLEKLGRAKLNLRALLEEGADQPLEFVTHELEQLRSDCGSIRAELEYHRTAHGC